jgi:hypothetical protein
MVCVTVSGLSGLTTLMQVRKSDIEQIQCNVFQVHVLSSVISNDNYTSGTKPI